MGFTAVDGLMMGTRCGALDAGVILYLMREYQMDAAEIEALIYRKSGLFGVSGLSPDMRTLRASTDPSARDGGRSLYIPHYSRGGIHGCCLGRYRCFRVLWRDR
jgi:acetate kinase